MVAPLGVPADRAKALRAAFTKAKENFPFFRFVEAKLRVNNPDEAERSRDLFPMLLMDDHFFPLDGQVSRQGILRILEEHKSGGALPPTVGQADIDQVLRKELVEEAWLEVSQTDEVKRNLEILQPVIERVGY